jgi:EmrB/QacA subfamily drug resistance transporter
MKRSAGIPHAGLLALLAVAEFMLTLDLSIVNVALPAIRADLGFSDSSVEWVINGYALTFAGFLLLGGRSADLFGGRRVFLAALTGFTVASLGCALASSAVALVAARVVQGLSAGVLAPTTLSILTATYRADELRARALAIWTAVAIGGGAAGGLLGGVLTSGLAWQWVFLVNVPCGGLLLVFAVSRLPTGHDRRARSLDVAGAITATGGLTALAWSLMRSADVGWGSVEVVVTLAVAGALLATFVVVETEIAEAPLVPFAVFRVRPVWAGNLLSFLSFVPVMATWFFLTMYLQRERGYSAVEAGLLFLPLSLAVMGGLQISFRLISRLDPRVLFTAGGVIAAAGLAWLARMSADTDIAWVIAPATSAMLGGGLMSAPITMAATSMPPEQAGLASGLLNTTRQVGGALGLAVLGTIAATGGYGPALHVGAAIFVATTIVGALALPPQPADTGSAAEPAREAGAARAITPRPSHESLH